MLETVASAGKTQLRYHRWAMDQVFAAIEQLPQEQMLAGRGVSFGSVHGTLLHIYQADSIWFSRLNGDTQAQLSQFAAPLEPAALKQEWMKLLDRIIDWAGKYPESEWSAPLEYFNSQGKRFETPVWQIVLHMVNHATGHLGQVSAILRQNGFTPASIDMIRFYRLTPLPGETTPGAPGSRPA
jgi:uncharacterized damage-inducible protein DinB